MEVRTATPDDAATLAGLRRYVHDIHVDAKPLFFKPLDLEEAAAEFERFLGLENAAVFIAYVDGQPVGYATVLVKDRPEDHLRYRWKSLSVDQIAVQDRYCRTGVGSALMRHVKKLADDLGIARIETDVWSFNEQSRAFFGAHGFSREREKLVMDI